MDHNNILGTVLAGGKSQRFGEDKSQVKLGDKLLIDYILSEIIDEFNEILVVSNNLINFKKWVKKKVENKDDWKQLKRVQLQWAKSLMPSKHQLIALEDSISYVT